MFAQRSIQPFFQTLHKILCAGNAQGAENASIILCFARVTKGNNVPDRTGKQLITLRYIGEQTAPRRRKRLCTAGGSSVREPASNG